MDQRLLNAFLESITDVIADKVIQRLSLRPHVNAAEHLVQPIAAAPLAPVASNDSVKATAAPSDADLLDTHQAAEILGVSPGTLENWRAQGQGPKFRKVGRLVRYRRGDLTG